MLELRSVTKRFGDVDAVREVSLSVPDGAFLVLLGPSGCGKTTLLRMLAGLEMPSAGQIVFDGQVVSDGDRAWAVDPARRNSGLVFQSYALWPHMTVRGNVEWPLKVAGMARPEREARVAEVLRMLGIDGLARRFPNEISGGQQQRVAIARTIAPRPGVLLFDEPLSNLDAKLRVEMRTELMRLHRATGATTVYVTHDQIEAMTMASHVAVMRAGRVEQFGTPLDLVERPETAFVATFVGTPPGNLVPVRRNGTGWVVGGRHMPLEPPADGAQALFRAETLRLEGAEGPRTLPLELAEVSTIAGRVMVTAIAPDLRLTAVTEALPAARVGETVHIGLPETPAAWFAPTGERIG
ncbi:ABC transporter ATP-binding protein [Rubellimicrobium sp. CFH 75288]|uniref:ABC transporter ATP-binding protein n=1 Tax=Rubellimicrobium sp. CFH 75288 TaxID=2697034 RepID=UPI001412B3C7|nr:ABC transporter ATP-binding protein [Rubellimicrobium sp. CFH 75288]NAZ36475.1 ATP-binding cassette domain-containing protein [Rubellimicrobium sp. CFH 75288]